MIPKNIINYAIEGGYGNDNAYVQIDGGLAVCFPGTDRIDYFVSKEFVLLDPLFWQSLGKALGYERFTGQKDRWKREWHRFIDALSEGTSDKFWQDLVPSNKE